MQDGILSDSTLESFSSETLSPDSSCDISNKSIESVTSSPGSREEETVSSKSTDHSERNESGKTSSYSQSSVSETLSGFTSADEDSTSQESVSPEDGFLRRCHQVLKNHSLGKPSEPKHVLPSSNNSPQMDFCEKCIKLALNSASSLESKLDSVVGGAEPEAGCCINTGIIERLKMDNLLHSMKEVTRIPEMPSLQHCQICRRMQQDIQERSFIQDKVRHLKSQLTEEKYQKYLTEMDSINQIGALAASLPKATDPPEEIWKKLIDR